MTIRDLRSLASFHSTAAANNREAATRMNSPASAEFSGQALLHEQWAGKLNGLADAFETFRPLIKEIAQS
jgi:hypothetical protein